MSTKEIFNKIKEPQLILEPRKPTKQQKYASILNTCLRLGVKIPSEIVAEYNQLIDIADKQTQECGAHTTNAPRLAKRR